MRDKPTVLVLAGHYRPGYRAGGPIASIENLVRALGDEFDFKVLALDHDLGEGKSYPPDTRRPEATYVADNQALRAVLRHVRLEKGVVYVQSPFSGVWGALPIIAARRGQLLIAPRGQLAAGALELGSRHKRKAVQYLGTYAQRKGAYWQATAESDADEMRAALPMVDPERILLAPNLPSDPGFVARRKPQGRLRTVYVGRIDPKKNLLSAIQAVMRCQNVTLEVVGPAEDADYAKECRKASDARVSFTGPLPPDAVRERLYAADAFLFPTFGENYGHSIVEAMLSGLPVLIGDTTPWRGLEETRAGFDFPPMSVDRFASALTKLAEMPEEEYVRWSEGARATIEAGTARGAAVEASRRMLLKVNDHARR